MEKLDLAKNIMNARIFTQNACESFDKDRSNKQSLPVNVRLLFLIGEYGRVSPSTLIDKLYIAKSNLALMCKQLISQGFIKVSQDLKDKRIIYYCLTQEGKDYLETKLLGVEYNLTKNFSDQDLQNLNQKLQELNEILSKKF